jgi:hypothetical protein
LDFFFFSTQKKVLLFYKTHQKEKEKMLRRFPLYNQQKLASTTTKRFCSSSSSSGFEAQVAAIFTANGQHAILNKKRQQLEEAVAQKFVCDEALEKLVNKKPDFYAKLTLSYLILQTGILNYWVYNRFDWCLCEPITYLLGTAVTFIALGYYVFTGSEYDWDVLRKSAHSQQRKAIYAKHNLDVEKIDALVKEIELLEEEIEHSTASTTTSGNNNKN